MHGQVLVIGSIEKLKVRCRRSLEIVIMDYGSMYLGVIDSVNQFRKCF